MAHEWQPDFEQLVDEHQSMVFSLALRMTGDRGLAEEIAQDVFLELDRNLGKIESAAARALLAAAGGDEPVGGCAAAAQGAGHGSVGGDGREPRRAVDERDSPLGRAWNSLLTTLPEPQRAALVLRYQEDLTPEEIAATLDAPLATVKSHLQRGLKLLRAKARAI